MNTNDKLRDKHAEALSDLRNGVEMDAAHDPQGADKLAALDYAIAALSALPAGGANESFCYWRQQEEGYDWFSTGCGREYVVNDGDGGKVELPYCPFCARRLVGSAWTPSDDTTPQPSAAEDYESWAKQERQREDTATRLGSADVGAQGDGEEAAINRMIARYLELEPGEKENGVAADHQPTRDFCRELLRAAAPAAGKGVDDAMRKLLAGYEPPPLPRCWSGSPVSVTWAEDGETSTREVYTAEQMHAFAIAAIEKAAAALTRQPVAGDGK